MGLNTASCSPGPGLHLRLLGRFELRGGDRPLRVSPAGERLVAYLGIHQEPVSRAGAACQLWPGCTDVRAAGNLRSALWRLSGDPLAGLITSTPRGLALAPGVGVDIRELSDRLPQAWDREIDIAMLRQDVLPEWPEEWLIGTREWFRQVRLHALETMCDRHRASGRPGAALEAGMAAVAADPLRESAHRRLALIHIAEGNFAEALRQYDLYRRLLRSELGLPPSPRFRKLVAPLLERPLDRPAR